MKISQVRSVPKVTTRDVPESLFMAHADIWSALHTNQYVRNLADGTLADEVLITWAQQCRLFCVWEVRATEVLLSYDLPKPLRRMLLQLAEENGAAPAELDGVLTSMGAQATNDAWPICLGYGTYLMYCARESLLEGLFAMYACNRACLDSSTAIQSSIPTSSRLYDWVQEWSGDEFRSGVEGLGSYVRTLAAKFSPAAQGRLEDILVTVARYELAFWDMCMRQEGWPAIDK
jgi:thiaminase